MDNLKNFVVNKGLEVADSINTGFITLNGKSVSSLVDSSNVLRLIDSAYVSSKSSGVDSAATSSLIDSSYIQARESVSISSFNTIAVAGQTDLIADSVGLSWRNSTEQAALINSDFSSTDGFSRFVDLAGDYALVSATAYDQTPYENNGAAFIFKRTDSAGGTGWAEQYKLYRSTSSHSQSFSWGVSLNDSATSALISNGGSSYAVTSYSRDSAASTTWAEGQSIPVPTDGSVQIYNTADWARDGALEQKGNYFAVGAKHDYGNGSSGTRYGSAWVYNRDSSGGLWALQQELIPSDDSDGAGEKKFGTVLSMPTDSLIAVSAPNYNNYTGAVYIFERDGSTWSQTHRITGPDGYDKWYGGEMQIDGDYMAVSSTRKTSNTGEVYIYKKIGGTWVYQQSVQASDAAPGKYFGSGLALRGGQLLVGAYSAGNVYVFQRFFEEWREIKKIEGSSLSSGANQLGGSVPGGMQINKDKTKNDFILGAYNFASYVFKVPTAEGPSDTLTLAAGPGITLTTDPSTETVTVATKDSLAVFNTLAVDGQPDVVTNSKTIIDYASISNQQVIIPPNGTASDRFGEGVAIDNGYAIINAKWSDSDTTNAGACYIYARSGTTWSHQQTITSPINNPTNNNFGEGAVDIKGSRVVIGAEYDDSNGTDAGAIYTFTRSGTTWTEEQRIVSSDIAAGDKFGHSVSMQGKYIAVGAYAKDDSAGGADQGSAYIFKALATTTLENAAFDNVQSLSLSAAGNTSFGNPDTMLFNSDGTKVYIYERTKDIIGQYSLAAPYDIVSNFRTLWAGKPGNAEYSVSIAGQSNMVIKGMRWNNDGTKIFVICNTNDKIYQHNLTTAYDISTASYSNKSFSTSAQETNPYGFTFNNDGTSMYICGVQEKKVFQYTLSTAYDLSTVSYANRSYTINASSHGNPGALQFDETGKKLFILHTGSSNGVRQHNLATAFDVSSSITVSHVLNIYTQDTLAMDFTFNADMSKLYAVGDSTNKIYQYSTSGAGAEWVQQAVLTPNIGVAGDQFGWDIELNEDASTVIVSANEHNTHANPIVTTGAGYGNTFVFTRSGTTWSQQAMLQPAGLNASQRSGNAASISNSGNYIGICVQNQDTPDGHVGTVYVFKKIGSAWVEQAKLYPNDANSNSRFSASIVMGDDFLAVGDYGANIPGQSNAGAVYFWKRSGETWTQINKIYAFDTSFGSAGGLSFGNVNMLAIDGNDILVGAYKAPAHTGPGRAYVFTATNTEILADTLTLAGGSGITLTNTSGTDTVTIASDITSIDTDLTSTDSDQVIHSFSKTDFRSVKYFAQLTTPVTPASITWDSAIDTAAIQHSGAANNDYFGVDVGIDGNYAIVGAYGDDEGVSSGGAAYVFFNDKGNGGWSQQALIGGDTNQDYFAGIAVAIGGSTKGSRVALGIPKYNLGNGYGRVMFYTRSGTTWLHQASINGALGATTTAGFGSSLAMSGDTTVVGAPNETSNTGRAYVYTGNGTIEQNIISSDAATGDKFGFSIDIDGDLMAVTAPYDDGQTGACYVFEKGETGTAGPLSNAVYVHKSPLTYQAGMTGDANANRPHALAFKPDGTKAYIADENSKLIYQYSLSTPYNVTDASMSYDSVSFNLQTSMGSSMTPAGMFLKPDGTKLYVLNGVYDIVYEYDMSTAYDLSTISYNSVNLTISSVEGFSQGIFFKPDGTKMYVTGTQNDSVRMIDLSTAWDVSTGTYNSSNTFSVSSQDAEPMDVQFNSSGTKMYILGGYNRAIYSYTLSTAWDVTTASYDSQSYSIASGTDVSATGAKALFLSADANANKLFVVGTTRDEVARIDMGVDYWVQKAKLVHTGAQGSDRFGYSVSCHKGDNGTNTIAVGHNDQRSAPTPPQGGGVFIFTGSGTSYTQQAKIVPADVATGDLFGSSDVNGRGISNQIQFNKGQAQGDTLFIGSMHDDDNSLSNSGSVYVFTRSGTTWSQAYKKTAFDKGPSALANFGASLDVDENGSLIVGAPIDDEGGTGRGTTYIFDPKQVSASTAKKVHSEEILLTHNETDAVITGYGKLLLDSDLGEFDAAINGSNVELKLTPTKTNTNVKLKAISTTV